MSDRYIVKWKNIKNPKHCGQGDAPMSHSDAIGNAMRGNKEYPELFHWVGKFELKAVKGEL